MKKSIPRLDLMFLLTETPAGTARHGKRPRGGRS
jgi:hypothetical protein